MADLGAFGAAVAELTGEHDTFAFFGEKFEVIGAMPPILMLQVAAASTGKLDETEGLAAIWQVFDTSLGSEEFGRFYRLATAKRADLDSLMALALKLFEAQAGRPTEEPAGSSPGQSSTSQPSSSESSQSVDVFAGQPHLVRVTDLAG